MSESQRHADRLEKPDLLLIRTMMVLGGMSPLFLLWAIRGTSIISDGAFLAICGCLIVIPNLLLGIKISSLSRRPRGVPLIIGTTEDRRQDILVYLFAMLLPFYSVDLDSWRNMIATTVAIIFIFYIFLTLNLHYMNIFFSLFRFRIFAVFPAENASSFTSKETVILITRRKRLHRNDRMNVKRLTNGIYVEV